MKNTQYIVADVRIERLLLLMRQVCYLYTTSAMFLILSHDTMRTKIKWNLTNNKWGAVSGVEPLICLCSVCRDTPLFEYIIDIKEYACILSVFLFALPVRKEYAYGSFYWHLSNLLPLLLIRNTN